MEFIGALLNALIFSLMGVVVFGISFYIADKLTPVNLWKELVDEKNVAVAIVAGAVAIAIGSVVAAAVHG
jgi:putative membrane protein